MTHTLSIGTATTIEDKKFNELFDQLFQSSRARQSASPLSVEQILSDAMRDCAERDRSALRRSVDFDRLRAVLPHTVMRTIPDEELFSKPLFPDCLDNADDPAYQWCEQNCSGDFAASPYEDWEDWAGEGLEPDDFEPECYRAFIFEKETDAVLFKLTWC